MPSPEPRRPQFTIAWLLLCVVVVAVSASVLSGMLGRAQDHAGLRREVFIAAATMAPMVLLLLVSGLRALILRIRRRRP